MIEKNYQPADIEGRMSLIWEDARAFKAGRPERRDAKPFTIVIPPPNVTGLLHMGHALNNPLQDILCRFERMRGRDVLWQPGTDHAGIATQMVVERQLMERQQPGRREMGREKFLERVWQWKEESGGTIVNQLKRLGASCDWSRERFTMDKGLSRAVIKVFVKLYEDGLIYKDKRLVNWDPKLLTAISDLEVQQVEVKGHMWYFNYPLEGETYDRDNPNTYITIATTRPETMLGNGAVAVRSGKTNFVPKNWEKTYFDWLENIQPWCISRQLWWGHQIPAWYGPDGKVFVAETEEEAVSRALAYYAEQEQITPMQGHDMAL